MDSDVEIARRAKLKPVNEIGAKLGVPAEALIPYGHTKAKISAAYLKSLHDRPDGDLVLEATYGRGDTSFKLHKPRFLELWAHYGKGDLSVDAMLQEAQTARDGSQDDGGDAKAQAAFSKMDSVGQQRMAALHGGRRDKLEVSPNLWAGVGLVRGGAGTALVGDPETVAAREKLGLLKERFATWAYEDPERRADIEKDLLSVYSTDCNDYRG